MVKSVKTKKRVSISKKLEEIEKKINHISKEEDRIEKDEKQLKNSLKKLSKEEEHIEKIIVKIGKINLKRKHLYELVRASAGAFLGVGLGRGLLGLDNIARNLAWPNVLGILVFILIISALLIYRDEKQYIHQKGKAIIIQRLVFIYFVSVFIEYLSLILFNVQYDSVGTLLKILIVGSYTAMASALSFSLAR